MQFINPLGFLLLGLVPVLIIIHSLKPKARDVKVTTFFLWKQVIQEENARFRLRRFINNLPLLLQILLIIIAALALSQPAITFKTPKIGNLILVMDISASMKSQSGEILRFDTAREKALQLIDELSDDSRVAVIAAGQTAELVAGFSEDRDGISDIIKKMQPTDVSGNLERALYLALSFLDPERDDWIFVVTDGAGGVYEKLKGFHRRVKPILIDGGQRNIGITKFVFRQELYQKSQIEILLEIYNFDENPVLCPVHVAIDDQVLLDETIGFKAMEKKTLIIPYYGITSGVAQATLRVSDDFEVDNKAFVVLNQTRDTWIQLVTKGNYYLEKLLSIYPNYRVNIVQEVIPGSWDDQMRLNEIIILDRMSPPKLGRGNFLLIDALSPDLPLKKMGELIAPRIKDWNRDHPLMANLDLTGLNIEKAALISNQPGIESVVESTRSGLVFAYQKTDLKAVYIGFDLNRSDLPLRVAFPVMMNNIFNWLNPNTLDFSTTQVQAGKPMRLHLRPQTTAFSIRTPVGEKEDIVPTTNPFQYKMTNNIGVYRVVEGEKRTKFAVNLADENESDIRPPVLTDISAEPTLVIESTPVPIQFNLWLIVLICGAAVLILEWFVWLRQ